MIATAAVGLLLVGCKPDPCPVSEDMVEADRAKVVAAQKVDDEASSRVQELENQIQSKQKRIRELEAEQKQIEAELSELLGT